MKIEHNIIQFRTTFWDNFSKSFFHYGFDITNGEIELKFVDYLTPNGKSGKLWQMSEIYHSATRSEKPEVPSEVMETVKCWYRGYVLSNL